MRKLRCLIVDDEALARAQLRGLLEDLPGAELAGEAANLAQARKAVSTLRPDVVLLDIQLRNESGLDLAGGLDGKAAVIFVTAHEKYAVRAFDASATDYLLKPVEARRLERALERARVALAEMRARESSWPGLVPLGATGEFAAAADILFIEAEGHRCRVALAGGGLRVFRQSFGEWPGALPAIGFVQLDRGVIVNLGRIASVEREGEHSRVRFRDDPTRLELGATASRRLREFLGSGG